jgi:hypothetical protein
VGKRNFYEVIVGNVGKVHEGGSKAAAISVFHTYKNHSKRNYGRAAGEVVTMYCDGEVVKGYDHDPANPSEEPKMPSGPRVKLFWKAKDGPAATSKMVWRDGWGEPHEIQHNDFLRLEITCEKFGIPLEMEKPSGNQ